MSDSGSKSQDDIFGAEFLAQQKELQLTVASLKTGVKKRQELQPEERQQVMNSYQKMRASYLSDSVLVAVLGLAVVLTVGTYKDALSYGLGSMMGLCYSVLLGKYVERIGTTTENKAVDGLRFAPVVFLVALYGKYRDVFSIIPELIGFIVSYQLSGLLQMFNEDPYGENEGKEDEND